MSKFELSLSKEYVPGWGLLDAIRELFQNALDQETTVPGNEMFWGYDPQEQELVIGNKLSVLDTSTLLLGHSSKRDDDKTIGQFGEGYKIATLVLLREGKNMIIENFGAREVWKPRFVKSRRYGAEILTFFTDKQRWTKVPDNNLTIRIQGITPSEYASIVHTNLHMREDELKDHLTTYGSILLNEKFKGDVYVNGLFVCNHEPYEYGYNFKSRYIRLDRDRKLVSDFDLKWLASKMWLETTQGEMAKLAAQLIAKGAADTAYVKHNSYPSHKGFANLSDVAHKAFTQEYGDRAIPVSTQEEAEMIGSGYRPVIVDAQLKEIIRESTEYVKPPVKTKLTYAQQLRNWFDEHHMGQVGIAATDAFEELVTKMEEGGI